MDGARPRVLRPAAASWQPDAVMAGESKVRAGWVLGSTLRPSGSSLHTIDLCAQRVSGLMIDGGVGGAGMELPRAEAAQDTSDVPG